MAEIYKMTLEDIMNYQLDFNKDQKNQLGEVFTPFSLILQMLDTLPKSVWSNPKLKWFDPAAGIGNFHMIIFFKLLDGLSSVIPNKRKRQQHIIRKMFVMCEINPESVSFARKMFGSEANIISGDYLDSDLASETYDIIVGNPPYNSEGNKHFGQKNLYVLFAERALRELRQMDIYYFCTHLLGETQEKFAKHELT